MLSLHLKMQPPINCSNQNLVFNARPAALSAFLVPYNVNPTPAISLSGMLNGIIVV